MSDFMAGRWQFVEGRCRPAVNPNLGSLAMNLDQQNAIAKEFFQSCETILTKKGKDYTPENVAFKDVDALAEEIGVEPKHVLWIFFRKHFTAVRAWIKKGQVESEPIEERLKDLANYCALLYVLVKREKQAKS